MFEFFKLILDFFGDCFALLNDKIQIRSPSGIYMAGFGWFVLAAACTAMVITLFWKGGKQ